MFIGGGAHGDEPAGAAAAEAIRHWPIVRGKLVVVPRANVPALKANKRSIPGAPRAEGNLNRNYPTSHSEAPRGTPAREIWALVLEQQPDWLLDLHEGYDFHQVNSNSIGSSILGSAHTNCETACLLMLKAINDTIPEPELKFIYRRMGTRGMLARAAADVLDIPAMILETTSKRPLGRARAPARDHGVLPVPAFGDAGGGDGHPERPRRRPTGPRGALSRPRHRRSRAATTCSSA